MILFGGFIFLVSVTTFYVQSQISHYGYCPIPIPVLMPTLASLGLFVGSLVYYIMLGKVEESREKRTEAINFLLELLPTDEKEVLRKIIENKGKITQSKLSSSLGKVKAFRVLESLRKRGIILKEPYGKTNIIKLNEKYSKILI